MPDIYRCSLAVGNQCLPQERKLFINLTRLFLLLKTMEEVVRKSKLLRNIFFILFFSLYSISFANAQSPIGTWSGLDKSNFQGQLRRVTLSLRPATPDERALLPKRSPNIPLELEIEVLAGEMVSSIPNPRRGQTHSETQNIIAAYIPKTNSIALFYYFGKRVDHLRAQVGVLDGDDRTIAFFHTGMAARNGLPFLLARGNDVPAQLEKLAGLKTNLSKPKPINTVQSAQQKRTNRSASMDARKAQKEAIKKYQPQIQQLQKKSREAMKAGNRQAAHEYQLQLQQITKKIRAIQHGETPGDSGIPTPKSATSCTKNLLNWAAEVEANGDQHENFDGLARVSNLFRDEYFVPHFGKRFNEFEKQEALAIGQTFRRHCIVAPSPLVHSRIAGSLSGAFTNGREYGRFDAASSAQALDILMAWQKRVRQKIVNSGTLLDAEAFETQRSMLAASLWPREQEESSQAMAHTVQSKVKEEVFSKLGTIIPQLERAEQNGLHELYVLKASELYQKVSPENVASFDQVFWQRVNPALSIYLNSHLQQFAKGKTPLETLKKGRKWYWSIHNTLATIAEQTPYKSFVKSLSIQREDAYAERKSAFFEEIESIDDSSTAQAFHKKVFIPFDDAFSPSWRSIKNAQESRIKKLDWELYLTRVGDGPFSPEYPGAVYLNAIYRGDTETMASEDKMFQQKLLAVIRPLLGAPLLSDFFLSQIKQSSVHDQLLAKFVVSYYNQYPACRSSSPNRIPVTTVSKTITTWNSGFTSEHINDVSTEIFLINPRHTSAWRSFEGKSKSPEQLRLLSLFSEYFVPQSKDLKLYNTMADTLEGLQAAMNTYPCDHDVIKTLESNMLAIYSGSKPSASPIIRTSWKKK